MSQASIPTDTAAPANGALPTVAAPPAATKPSAAIVPAAEAAPATDAQGKMLSAFASIAAFEAAQRMAKSLAASTLVPDAYQNNIPNVLIAMELASRIGASVFMVMQNLDVIHGRPGWRAQFLIATVNMSGRFTPLRFRWQGKPGTDEWGCRAVARDRETGEECEGALITIGIAKAEGWYSRNGSKWKTMPEQMLMYRSGAFWERVYCPELGLGMTTAEEIIDTVGVPVPDMPTAIVPGSTKDLENALLGAGVQPSVQPVIVETKEPAKAETKAEAKPAKAATKQAELPNPDDHGR
jgi:hypothetical protein